MPSQKPKHQSGIRNVQARKFAKLLAGHMMLACATHASALEVQWHETERGLPVTFFKSCKETIIYGKDEFYMLNYFNTDSEFIISRQSRVDIWTSPMVSIDGTHVLASNYTPGPGEYVWALQTGKTKLNLDRLKPEHRGRVLAKLAYNLRVAPRGPGLQPEFELISQTHNPKNKIELIKTSYGFTTKSFNTNEVQNFPSCREIKARWCGDGVVDADHGEQCDAGLNNGKEGSACNAQCQSVVAPQQGANQ